MTLPLGSNKVLGWIKQGGGPDSARGPCVCHLCCKASLDSAWLYVLTNTSDDTDAPKMIEEGREGGR